jgi:hypothetical protein
MPLLIYCEIHIHDSRLTNLMPKWLTFSAVSTSAAQFFEVTESSINWLSTGFLFAFVAVTP